MEITQVTHSDSGGFATITWKEPPASAAVTGYRMSRDGIDAHDVGDWTDDVGPRTSFTHTNLAPGNSYNISVQAINATGVGPKVTVPVVMGGRQTPAPVPPQSFKVVRDPSGLTATITWDRPLSNGGSKTTAYQVARDGTDSNGFGAFSEVIGVPAGPPYAFVFTNLVPTQSYNFSVAAVNALGTGVSASLPA